VTTPLGKLNVLQPQLQVTFELSQSTLDIIIYDTMDIRTLQYDTAKNLVKFFYPKQAMNSILNSTISIFSSCGYSKFLEEKKPKRTGKCPHIYY
jgi:hypothetical protein